MISYEKAYEAMMSAGRLLATESVPFAQSVNRVLARDVASDIDMPPFNKSAMDGFACRRADLANPLTIIEEIPAGTMPQKPIACGECARIMTGAPVPEGADCVIMVEHTAPAAGNTIRFTGERTADNICAQGEDIRTGDVVLSKGERITPAHIAVLATVGCTQPQVYIQPRVTLMATGSELIDPAEKAHGACIRNSNTYQLAAQLRQIGAQVDYLGIVEDNEQATVDAIRAAVADHDVILISGGVSAGDYDFVPAALKDNGFSFSFESVAMQPGHPTVFGQCADTYCFGLPGNPVSTFIIVELMVKPFLLSLMGGASQPTIVEVALAKAIRRRKHHRQSTIPIALTAPDEATPVEYHGSAHINALSKADGLFTIPVGTREIPQGTRIHVRLL